MNLTILSFRSGTNTSLQGIATESTGFNLRTVQQTITCDRDHSDAAGPPFTMWRFLLGIMAKPELESGVLHGVNQLADQRMETKACLFFDVVPVGKLLSPPTPPAPEEKDYLTHGSKTW